MKSVEIPTSSPSPYVEIISQFKGVDLYNPPTNVDKERSPDAPNMIRDVPGKVKKRCGYKTVKSFEGRINAHFRLIGDAEHELIHAGTNLYVDDTLVYTAMEDTRSVAWQFDGKLYILDGKEYLVLQKQASGSGYEVKPVTQVAYVPTISIGRAPSGGGTPYEPINLLQNKWTETFLGTETDKEYQLSFKDLDAAAVTAEKLNSSGGWDTLTEGTHFNVNRTTGKVTFTSAPGKSPVTGMDNVKITASKDRSEYRARINKCRISILYGVNGSADRLFVSGNPDLKNYDWYSQLNDPTYFGDTWYAIIGQDSSAIVGYSIVADKLATHKDNAENGRNVVMRHGTMVDDQAAFPVSTTLQGEGAIAPFSLAYLGTEPLFLTRLGIYAITPQDVSGERYTQSRSFFLDKALIEEPNLTDAYATIYKDFYILAVNSRLYILDGLVKTYERGAPYSTYQYEGYYWTNVPARVLWEDDGHLYFGTSDGKINRFWADGEDPEDYCDNGVPVMAHWDLADFDGRQFYTNKTIRYIAVRLAAATATSVKVQAQIRGLWSTLREVMAAARYFQWTKIEWSKFSWSPDSTPRTIGRKIKVKKVDKTRFRLLNDQNEPFGVYDVALEFRESGRYKR